MRDGHDRLAFHQAVQALLDGCLSLAVERARRLVEQQDRRVLQHYPCDGNPLALATAELHASFADLGIETRAALRIGERGNELVRFRTVGGRQQVGVRRIGTAIQNVLAHRAVQQAGVLGHHADLRPQRILRHMGDVLPVD